MTESCPSRRSPRRKRERQRGVALLVTVGWLALMVALVSEYTYGTSVDTAQAANARDELRAHYMARSAISLSRLLIKIQQRFIDPVMGQAQQMLNQAGGGDLGLSLRLTDYAGPIMGLFGGSAEEVKLKGAFIGLDVEGVKGLGMKAGRIDAEIVSEDGKIDLNCGSGLPGAEAKRRQTALFRLLTAMMYSPRYDKLFSEPNRNGEQVERAEVARALVDWADADEQMFSLEAGGAPEDYRYDGRKDRYKAHDGSFDTVEEIALVRGVSAGFMEAFGPYLTVYPSDPRQECRVNIGAVKGDCTPLLMGLLRAAAMPDPNKAPADPAVLDDRYLFPIASVMCERASVAGFDSLDGVVNLLANPQGAVAPEDPRFSLFQAMRGITVTKAELEKVAYVGPPRVFRVVGTGQSGRVKKKITAILDMARSLDNPVTQNPVAERASGALQYWREE